MKIKPSRYTTLSDQFPYEIILPDKGTSSDSLGIVWDPERKLLAQPRMILLQLPAEDKSVPRIVSDICRRFPIDPSRTNGLRGMPRPAASCTGSIEIVGERLTTGSLFVAIFDTDKGWPGKSDAAVKTLVHLPASGPIIPIPDLQTGKCYAISVHYDVNGNNKLDTRLGIPTEPFAVSNDAPGRMGPPSFRDSAFLLTTLSTDWRRTLTLRRIALPRFRL